VDAPLLVRAFCVLGPTEAVVEIAAFVIVLSNLGWQPSSGSPSAQVLAVASGAAFLAIVIGQSATALACRSWSRPGWRVPIRTNPLLLTALLVSGGIAVLLLAVTPLSRLLGHAVPPIEGLFVAIAAFPASLLADAAHKAWLGRKKPSEDDAQFSLEGSRDA